MSTTTRIMNKDSSLKLRPEPSNDAYQCFNTGGVEIEVGEFLYGLVRMMKPKDVFETGTHQGVSSSYIARALQDNNHGMLTTIEIDKEHIAASKNRWKALGLSDRVVVDKEPSLEYTLEYDVDLMLLDSEPEFRFKELLRFYPRLKRGGYVFIHDLHRHLHQIPNEEHGFAWPYGIIPTAIVSLVKEGRIRPFHFGTPRGLTGFYKVSDEDYKYEK